MTCELPPKAFVLHAAAKAIRALTDADSAAALREHDKEVANSEQEKLLRALNETIKMLSKTHAIELPVFSEWPCINLASLLQTALALRGEQDRELFANECHAQGKELLATMNRLSPMKNAASDDVLKYHAAGAFECEARIRRVALDRFGVKEE